MGGVESAVGLGKESGCNSVLNPASNDSPQRLIKPRCAGRLPLALTVSNLDKAGGCNSKRSSAWPSCDGIQRLINRLHSVPRSVGDRYEEGLGFVDYLPLYALGDSAHGGSGKRLLTVKD